MSIQWVGIWLQRNLFLVEELVYIWPVVYLCLGATVRDRDRHIFAHWGRSLCSKSVPSWFLAVFDQGWHSCASARHRPFRLVSGRVNGNSTLLSRVHLNAQIIHYAGNISDCVYVEIPSLLRWDTAHSGNPIQCVHRLSCIIIYLWKSLVR